METETFQHYRILRREDGSLWELGRGAMAVTYKAYDVNLCCPVALKVINSLQLEDEHTRARFVREARAAAALRHRNIAGVHHLGSDGQSYFYAMEFVDGETVADLVIRRGPLPPAEALAIAAQVARALGAAAKQGLVHRDIKPANIMVVHEDEDDPLLVKVIDFGLARRAAADPAAQITLSGFVGTPQYASPEQVAERDLDSRSDIYSLGVTLWYTLTGQPTFTGLPAQVGAQHLGSEPPWATVAHLPAPVRALLARTLQKNPADRPQEPSTLRREIESCLEALETGVSGETLSVPPTGPAARTTRGDTLQPPRADPSEDATLVPAAPAPVPEGPAPEAGEVFAERYNLLESVGEGRAGRVFRAQDTRAGGRSAAIKIFRPELPLSQGELQALRDDFRRLRAAPHPRLIEFFAFDQSRGYRFLASEWINGFTLVDLLRHRGRLELLEALHLLEHASDAAAHGSANGLRRLELAPHQVLIHFPAAFDGDKARAVHAMVDRPLARWPEFSLKIDALAPARETGRTPTWAGAMTLVPTHGQRTDSLTLAEENYFYALGSLLYETLSGAPLPVGTDGRGEAPPLPTLGEEANDLLQRAVSAAPGFRDEREFFDALLSASGLERADLRFRPAGVAPVIRREVEATVVPSAIVATAPNATGEKSSFAPPAALRMAAPIRTKLLRPRTAATPTRSIHRTRGSKGLWPLVIAVVVGIAVALAVIGVLMWSKHLPPFSQKPAPAASPAGSP